MANKQFNELTDGVTPQDGDRMGVDRGGGPWSTVYLTMLALYIYILTKLTTDNRAVPTGGSVGDVLKRGGVGSLVWSGDGLVPDSSVTGYVLTQLSGTAGDYDFAAPAATPPAGSAGQIQYHDGGPSPAFAGALLAGIGSTGSHEMTLDTAPPTPASGKVGWYAGADAASTAPAWIDSTGKTHRVAERGVTRRYTAALAGSATLSHLGLTISGDGAGGAATNDATALPKSALHRMTYTSAGTAGASAGLRFAQFYLYRGADASSGGFRWRCVWSPNDAATVANRRCFVGLIGATGAFGNVDPSSKTNIFAMGADSGDTDLSILHNDGAGTATKIALTGFAQADIAAIYEVELWCVPGGSALHYRVAKRVSGGAPTIIQGSVSSEIPAATQLLTHYVWVNNGTTALAASVAFAYLEVETDV